MSNTQANGPLDLSTNLESISTEYPVLVAGEYRMAVADAQVVDAPSDKEQSHNLKVQFSTVDPSVDLLGNDIPAGHKVSRTYPLLQSWERDIVKLIDAALGIKDKTERAFSLAAGIQQIRGRTLLVRLDTRDSPDYGMQNEVKGYRILD